MASTYSFDVVSDFDRQELVNVVDQVRREVVQRYDLKDTNTDIDAKILSNDPKEKYIPGVQKPLSYRNLKDGFFHQESTLLTNPPMDLRGQTKNRWIPLHLDPRINSIEPFRRNGDDTYLALIDNFKDCKA